MVNTELKNHPVVSRAEWLAARVEHLAKEKEFTRLRDEQMNAGYHYLDLVPKGRDEAGQTPHPQAWVRHRDNYDN
jgi:predicted dithiol-disulfide oxidoreductase (DUF899 family)